MRVVVFAHSFLSDWNNTNAHFLRGLACELMRRGHEVVALESENGWSRRNLVAVHGQEAFESFRHAYPNLRPRTYVPDLLDLDAELQGAELVLVHEWNPRQLIERIGSHRATHTYRLLFYDTRRRVDATETRDIREIASYDALLVGSEALREHYEQRHCRSDVFVLREAADTARFRPYDEPRGSDLVWFGNWGDSVRSNELRAFLLQPIARLRMSAVFYGSRYPDHGRRALSDAGVVHGGWLANHAMPSALGRSRMTVHVPSRTGDAGAPIRVLEALACGVPIIVARGLDDEGALTPGVDYLVARDPEAMERHMDDVLHDPDLAASLVTNGLRTIAARHTCQHRVDELFSILERLGSPGCTPLQE